MLNLKDFSHVNGHDILDDFLGQKMFKSSPNYNSYKGNWKLLMQIIEKIEDIEWEEGKYTDVFIGPGNHISIHTPHFIGMKFCEEGDTKVDSVYSTVLKFATWYKNYTKAKVERDAKEKTIVGNVIIAEAIGLEQADCTSGLLNYKYGNSYFEAHELSFEVSWDWLLYAAHIIFKDNPYGFNSFIVENLINDDIGKAFEEVVYYIDFNNNNK